MVPKREMVKSACQGSFTEGAEFGLGLKGLKGVSGWNTVLGLEEPPGGLKHNGTLMEPLARGGRSVGCTGELMGGHWKVLIVGVMMLDLGFGKALLIDSMGAGGPVVKSGVCEMKQQQWAEVWC